MRTVASLGQISETSLRIAQLYHGLAFTWEEWQRPREDWDHDHCFFCRRCICDSGQAGHIGRAYVLRNGEDAPFWVCRSCFKVVRKALEWKIRKV